MAIATSHESIRSLREKIHVILDPKVGDEIEDRLYDAFMVPLIFLNILSVILETEETIYAEYSSLLWTFEVFSVIIFTIEYALRLWSCTADDEFIKPVMGRIRYALTPMALVDLVSILPFYLPMFIPFDLRFVRALRLLRLFRLLKSARYSNSLHTIGYVLKSKKEQLVITAFATSILVVFASSLMYFVESEAQPKAFSSIPATMWWAVATLTTVGYGDIYPITPLGKFMGSIIAILGIGLFALPTGIIATGFVETMQADKCEKRVCPHCGQPIEDI
ncbi:MAG: ion transporter [Chloroflexi bacterium]|nr:ion transporter [Chloroflexota bacterium]